MNSTLAGKYFFDDGTDRLKTGRSVETTRAALHVDGLCSQVADALSLVFGGSCDDERLWDLGLDSVRQSPGDSRLIVTVYPLPGTALTAGEILDVLKSARSFLKREVAEAICRKRTPELVFRVIPGPSQEAADA